MAKAKIATTDDPVQDAMNKMFGAGSVLVLGSATDMVVGDGISTGSLKLDLALGGKGLPLGRIIELVGAESSSKTSLSLKAMAAAQKKGMECIFVDAEHSLDPSWANNLGVDIGKVKISQPSCGEEGLIIAENYLKCGKPCFIVIDSVAALTPRKELEGDIGDSHVGLQARMMSQACRKLTGAISSSGSIVVFLNQIREKIGVSWGSNETTPGGRALKFYSTCRIDLRRIATLKSGETNIGIRVKAKVLKNKVAPPFREAEYSLFTRGGISWANDVLDLSVDQKLIKKTGSWFYHQEKSIGQGENNAIQWLEENPEVMDSLEKRIRESSVAGGEREGCQEIGSEGESQEVVS